MPCPGQARGLRSANSSHPNTTGFHPILDAVARARSAYPDVTIEQFGEANANKWFNDTIMKDFKRAEWTAEPLALGIVLVCSAPWWPPCCPWCLR
jgi:hypothetical protein